MLTRLATVKARLAITVADYDTILTNAIKAVSARFDKECNRTFEWEDARQQFAADETEIIAVRYPVQYVMLFQLKSNETEGWETQGDVECLIRRDCIISLPAPLGTCRQQAVVTYGGGYDLPGNGLGGGIPLPDDLEQAAVEQVAAWFQNRGTLGLDTIWPHGGTYEKFLQSYLLLDVKAVLKRYERWIC